eukprot:4799211-Amphidinium_carterae.1
MRRNHQTRPFMGCLEHTLTSLVAFECLLRHGDMRFPHFEAGRLEQRYAAEVARAEDAERRWNPPNHMGSIGLDSIGMFFRLAMAFCTNLQCHRHVQKTYDLSPLLNNLLHAVCSCAKVRCPNSHNLISAAPFLGRLRLHEGVVPIASPSCRWRMCTQRPAHATATRRSSAPLALNRPAQLAEVPSCAQSS